MKLPMERWMQSMTFISFFQIHEHLYSNNVSSDKNFSEITTKVNLCYTVFDFVDICSPRALFLPLIFWKLGHGL